MKNPKWTYTEEEWKNKFGENPTEQDVKRIFEAWYCDETIVCGYGYYGCRIDMKNRTITASIGSSCD